MYVRKCTLRQPIHIDVSQMQFTTSTLLAALAVAVSAAPSLYIRQNGVSCQTTDGSPYTVDVTNVINEIRGRGDDAICVNQNGEASGMSSAYLYELSDLLTQRLECTTLASQDSAAIAICGSTNTGTTCTDVLKFANNIQQTCQQGAGGDNLVGGTYTINGGLRVEVIHS
jgi:hypothetical protein